MFDCLCEIFVFMPSILIVDDDADFRQGLRILLENRKHRVIEAPDGKAAMDFLRQSTVSLIVTDLVMPEQEGIETIQAIRHTHPELKIVAISGAEPHFLRVAKALGAHGTVQKSMRLDEIAQIIENFL
jgi:DNA-binding NarL/FixJ family response regulator